MAWSRRDLFKRDGQKLQLNNPYMQGAQKPGDMQPLYNQKKGLPDENYHSPSMKGNRIMDAVVTTAGIAMPAGRMEEWIATAIGRIMPAIEKAWPKVMARFGNLLKKAKGNPEALAKIATRFEDDMWGMMLHPSQLQKSNPNYLDNINAVSDFKSRPVGELKGKTKIDTWLESKPAYERKAMGKPQANKSRTFEDELEEIHNSYKDRTEYLDGYWQDRDTLMKYEFDAKKDIEALGKKYNKEITEEHYPWHRVFKNNEPDLWEEWVDRFINSRWKKQAIDDYPNQKARDKGDAQDFAENHPRDKELESDNDFLKNKNSQRRKQFDELPEDIKKKYIKEYEQLKYEKQQDINRTDVWEWYGDYDDIEDAFDSDMAALNKKYWLSPFFDMADTSKKSLIPAYERMGNNSVQPTKPQAPKDMEDVFFEGLYKPTKKERLAADLDPNSLASNEERYAERVEDQLSPNELNALREAQHRGLELEWTDKAAWPLPSNIKKIIDNIFKRFPNYNPGF